MKYLIIYLIVINLVAVIATVADKRKAKKGAWRIKERTLLIISALGGSIAMLITMKKIRHKTKHKKFMVGIPAIIIAQLLLAIASIWFFVFK
jgi:uncharacterized membrane protein YsdA (DUF1294 family)